MPLSVLEEAQREFLDYKGTGMGIVEISHRSKEYAAMHEETKALLRELMEIPEDYEILFIQGGVEVVEANNKKKAQLIYDVIDASNGFYLGHAEKDARSMMNITFNLATPEMEKDFLEKGKAAGFVGIGGHRSVGGCRASTYNAVPMEACEALAAFMKQYQQDNQ